MVNWRTVQVSSPNFLLIWIPSYTNYTYRHLSGITKYGVEWSGVSSTGWWYDEESTGRSNDHRYFSNTVAKAFQLFAEPLRFVVVEIDFSNLPLRVFKGGHPADHPPVVYKQSPGVELSSVWIIALEFEVHELNFTHYSDYSQCASRSRMNRFLVSIDWEIYLWWIRDKC